MCIRDRPYTLRVLPASETVHSKKVCEKCGLLSLCATQKSSSSWVSPGTLKTTHIFSLAFFHSQEYGASDPRTRITFTPCWSVPEPRGEHTQNHVHASSATHQDDRGEIDADGEVGDGQHIASSQLHKLDGPDEALHVLLCPTESDHHILDQEA